MSNGARWFFTVVAFFGVPVLMGLFMPLEASMVVPLGIIAALFVRLKLTGPPWEDVLPKSDESSD